MKSIAQFELFNAAWTWTKILRDFFFSKSNVFMTKKISRDSFQDISHKIFVRDQTSILL